MLAALTANALRPVPGFRAGLPAFAAGWVTGELAPQLLAASAADTALHLARGRRDPRALALAGATTAGLARLVRESRLAEGEVEAALVEALGDDYREHLGPLEDDGVPARTPWRRLVNPVQLRAPGVHVERDISYAPWGRRGLLDVYRPAVDEAGTAPADLAGAPVLVQVHGGGWTMGTKDTQGLPLMRHLARRGWVCVSLNYRLAPRDRFPAQIEDVKRVLAWVKQHAAAYGGDPSYVAITGGSAGGHLAALAALTPHEKVWQPGFEDADTSVVAAVPFYGVYDFAGATGMRRAEQLRDRYLAPRVLGRRWTQDPEAFESASPLLQVTPDAPDFLVIHGRRDSLVPVDQARQLVHRLREATAGTGTAVAYAELTGAQHAFDVLPSIRTTHVVDGIERFLRWHWHRRSQASG